MLRFNRIHLFVLVLVTVLLFPTVLPASGAIEQEPVIGSLRFHKDGWLGELSPDQQTDALSRYQAWMDAYAAQVEQRPPVDPVQQSQTVADWTVMVYLAADNNLEAAGLFDLNEMESVGSSPNVNILVQIDRSAEYVDYDGDWTESRRYFVQQDNDLDVINSPVVENMGEINSGDADSVADFAIWGITNYPAQKYMLVLWDHGGGWISHASDDDTGDDIDLVELRAALERIIADTGIEKFEVLGFDMCLMGQLEVFETLAPYARYGLGSEENEPGAGWFYVWLEQLVDNPAMNGDEVSRHVVDYYIHFFEEIWPYDAIYGLGAVDLSKIGNVITALDQLTETIKANPQASLSAVADARNNTIGYGGFDDPRYYDVWSSVDLYQFADLLSQISTSPEVQQAAQNVMQAVSDAVVAENHITTLDGSHGISIYFPRTYKAFKIVALNERYPVEQPASMAGWLDFLTVFHGTATETVVNAPVVDVLSVYPDVASIYQPAVVSMEVSGRDILQVNYAVARVLGENERVVLDFDYLVSRTTTPSGSDIVNWADGVTTRTFVWEAEVPVISDGVNSTFALLIPNLDDPNVAVVNGMFQSVRGDDPIEAQMVFNLETSRSTALWGFSETSSGAVTPFELQIEAGDTFQPIWLTLDAENNLSGSNLSDVTLTLNAVDSITFEKVPAPSGDYAISFVAENVAGEKTLDEAVIQVNNEGLDPTLRGYTDLAYGVNFLYPSTWLRPRFTPDGLRLFTADMETLTILSLFPYTSVSSAEETDAAIRASWSDLADLQITNQREVEIQGMSAYVTDYTYSADGEPRVGAVIGIYVPDQGVGYGFDLDAPASTPAPAQQALQALVDSINFFASDEVVGQSTWQTQLLADGLVSVPVPINWQQEFSGNWTLFGPVDDDLTFIGFSFAAASGQANDQLAQYWVEQLQDTLTNLEVLASEPYYVGNEEWHLVVFTYDTDEKIAGAFFVTSVGGQDYVFWIEAPDAQFDALFDVVFSVSINGFTFNG